MTYRIAWVSPLTPNSGVGTFSKAILDCFPDDVDGEAIDVTAFYVDHTAIYPTRQRAVKIVQARDFREIFGVFDLIVYNIGNNREHHGPIYELLQIYPGIVICHDYVYQHYLAERAVRASGHFASYAALLRKFCGAAVTPYVRRSQITSRIGRIRYSPWDTALSVDFPMSEALLKLGSALVVHSRFSHHRVEAHFAGPILQLGMPFDQRSAAKSDRAAYAEWERAVLGKDVFDLVSFGYIQSAKCLDLVVEAIGGSTALRRKVKYTIAGFVGDYDVYEELRARVQMLGLTEVVRFEVGVSDRRLERLMLDADAFINLRRPNTEAASLSLVEQMQTGRPVIVLDRGCYAEVPDGAAIKLEPDVSPTALGHALGKLFAAPRRMVAIGRAGRQHARTWTSRGYAEKLVRFALAERAQLQRRGGATFYATRSQPEGNTPDRWLADLARARAALVYLDRNVLAVDPSLILGMSHHELCDHIGDVIFGIFNSPKFRRALSRYLAGLDRHATFWACVTFTLLADAVFTENVVARARLMNGRPHVDPEFWAVVELLPLRQFVTAATLMLAKRPPTPEELAQCDRDGSDRFPVRARFAELLAQRGESGQALMPLANWAAQMPLPPTQRDLLPIDDTEIEVGSNAFRDTIDLSGFHTVESDRVWTRGETGFIGLRLPEGGATVELQVYPLVASPEAPCVLGVTCGDAFVRTEVRDQVDRWVQLALHHDAAHDGGLVWIKLTTDRAAIPPDSADPRLLGVCLRRVRVKAREQLVDLDIQRARAVSRLNQVALQMRRVGNGESTEGLKSTG